MDPETCLTELLKELRNARMHENGSLEQQEYLSAAWEHAEALAEWLRKGGFPPDVVKVLERHVEIFAEVSRGEERASASWDPRPEYPRDSCGIPYCASCSEPIVTPLVQSDVKPGDQDWDECKDYCQRCTDGIVRQRERPDTIF